MVCNSLRSKCGVRFLPNSFFFFECFFFILPKFFFFSGAVRSICFIYFLVRGGFFSAEPFFIGWTAAVQTNTSHLPTPPSVCGPAESASDGNPSAESRAGAASAEVSVPGSGATVPL